MIKRIALALAAGLLLATTAGSQPHPMMGGGMGPGMMGGGYGMGPGMMGGGGPGGWGMGPGMMWRHDGGDYRGLDLSAEQRVKIEQIMEETAKARWALMGTMHQQDFHMHGMFGRGAFDEQQARKSYQAMSEAHKAMFELHLDARKRIDAVLTKEQREKLQRGR